VAQNRISDPSGEAGLFANIDGNQSSVHTARGTAVARDARTAQFGSLSGDTWFNTDTTILQVYDGTAWKNVYTPPPSPTSVSPTTITGAPGSTITVIGTGFSFGAAVQFVSSVNGNTYNGTSVQFLNSSTLTVQNPALSKAGAPYAIKVTNLDNGAGTSTAILNVDAGTAFITTAGSLGSSYSGLSFTYALQATSSLALIYSLASGSLPTGLTLASSGIISGTLPTVSSQTTYTFSATITDTATTAVTRSFSITVVPYPTITSLSPTTGNIPGTATITVTGTNLVNGSTITFTDLGSNTFAGTSTVWSSSTTMTSVLPSNANVTPLYVQVKTPDNLVTVTSPSTIAVVLPFITSNLVLRLDSSLSSSYPGSGTTWYDISGQGYNFSMNSIGTTTYSGALRFTFNGANSYANNGNFTPYSGAQHALDSAATYFMVLKRYNAYDGSRKNPWDQSHGGWGTFTSEGGGTMSYYNGTGGGNTTPYQGSSSSVLPVNTTFSIALVRNTVDNRFYFQGNLDTVTTNSYPTTVNTITTGTIGNGYAGYYYGEISVMAIYARALTPSEILQNHNNCKSRFTDLP
jgi:Putative Ig domain/Concanavalin A-like lectin/glucanases superfamily/IPT/TIG domain